MTNTIKNTVIILAGAFLLNACGSSGPEETAEEFVTLISDADLDEAKKISDKTTQSNIDYLAKRCRAEERDRLSGEVSEIARTIVSMRRNGTERDSIKEAFKAFRKKYTEAEEEKYTKEIVAKYGSLHKIPKDKRDEVLFEGFRRFEKPAGELADTLIELSGKPATNREEVRKALAYYIIGTDGDLYPSYQKRYLLNKITDRIVRDRNQKPAPDCMESQSPFGMIDDVNIIETTFESPDVASVRLELVREDGTSRKEVIDLEKIQGEWKVAGRRLQP